MTTRIAYNGFHTEFSSSVKATNNRDEFGAVKIMRVYHPTEGEQVRLELLVGKTIDVPPDGMRTSGRRTTSYERTLTLTPEQADQLVAAIQGVKRK